MQEIFEKIKERLEEKLKEPHYQHNGEDYFVGICEAIEIVNQVAEEYKGNIRLNLAERYAIGMELYGVDITEKWLNAAANESALSRAYMLGKQDGLNKFDKWREEYGNGWIPCSERLPEIDGKYIVCTTKGSVYCTKYHSRGKIFGTDMNTHIEAWQTLPDPYKPKGENNNDNN